MLIMLLALVTIWLLLTLWAILSFRRASKEPPRRRIDARVTELENQMDDVDSRLEYIASELKSVRGRQFALMKRNGTVGAEEAPGPGDDSDQVVPTPHFSTAHLAARFKGGR